MEPFDSYPGSGHDLLGRLKRDGRSARGKAGEAGYVTLFQRLTDQSKCAYCGVRLVDTYEHWLLVQADHVVPESEAKRLGIPAEFYLDCINVVLACSGCNGFKNRDALPFAPQPTWSMQVFLTLRDEVFLLRSARIEERRKKEISIFESKPWQLR